MPLENYHRIFDLEEDEFSGFLSDSEITDIEETYIAAVITERDITKMCDQLDHSMGSYMVYFQILCILLSAVLIYLLSTTMILIVSDVVSVILGAIVMTQAWRVIMSGNSGWFAFVIEPAGYVKMFLFVLIGYLFVMILDFARIKKIPMGEALKSME